MTHTKRTMVKRRKKRKTIPRSAIVDHLTRLYNRRHFDKSLKKIIRETKNGKRHFSLLMVDIDNFKAINDKYGHLAGDTILKSVTKILKDSVRRVDTCFRYGGDEIAIILPDAAKDAAENIIERLKNKVERGKFLFGEHTLYVKLSIGLAVFSDDGMTPEALIERADALLYEAKRRKKRKKRKIAESFILRTKLTLPSLKKTTIIRSRIISSLKDHLDKKFILIIADAGYGKTTLLTQLIRGQDLPVVFYDLDKEDSDAMLFLSYVTYGLEQVQPNVVERTNVLLEQGVNIEENYELVMGTLINELMEKRGQELFIVLDDYHTISEDSVVHKLLDYFIDNVPDTVHVVMASRAIPSLSLLAKWRAKQDMFELSRDDLKFNQDEVKELLTDIYHVVLPEEELKLIFEHTEGWITGVQLILQSAGKDKDRETVKETLNGYIAQNKPLFDYFANEVLRSERSKVREFLKYSSILEIMTPDACNTIFELKNSAQLLQDLEKRNVFLSAVIKEEYKYHHLFKAFLHTQFIDNNLKKTLNMKAAQYYKQRKLMEQAIQHYLEAGSFVKAAKLIVQVAEQMRERTRFTTLGKWLKQIPESLLQKYPRLLLTKGSLYQLHGNPKDAEEIYIRAAQVFRDNDDLLGLAEALQDYADLLWMTRSYDKSLKIARRALKLCPASEKKQMAGILDSIGLAWAGLGDFKKARVYLLRAYRTAEHLKGSRLLASIGQNLAALHSRQGEIKLAFKLYASIIDRRRDYYLRAGVSFASAAAVALSFGKEEWAEQVLHRGWKLCQPYEDPWSMINLHIAFGLLYTQKAEWKLAEKHLLTALKEITQLKWPETELYVLRYLCSLYRYQRNFTKAEKYLARMRQKTGDVANSMGVRYLAEASLLYVALGRFDEAHKAIKINLRLLKKYESKVNKSLCDIAFAAVHLGKGKKREAIRLLRRAFSLAKAKGYEGLVVHELRYLPQLASLAKKHGIEKKYISSSNLEKSRKNL